MRKNSSNHEHIELRRACWWCGQYETTIQTVSTRNEEEAVQVVCLTCNATGPKAKTPFIAMRRWNAGPSKININRPYTPPPYQIENRCCVYWRDFEWVYQDSKNKVYSLKEIPWLTVDSILKAIAHEDYRASLSIPIIRKPGE